MSEEKIEAPEEEEETREKLFKKYFPKVGLFMLFQTLDDNIMFPKHPTRTDIDNYFLGLMRDGPELFQDLCFNNAKKESYLDIVINDGIRRGWVEQHGFVYALTGRGRKELFKILEKNYIAREDFSSLSI